MLTDTAGTTCYFRANDGTTGTELWKTDGTTAGTVQVADIRAGPFSSSPDHLTNFAGTVLFTAYGPNGTELYTTNGTAAGTTELVDINPGTSDSSPNLFYLAIIGSDLYFAAFTSANGRELWKTNGTAAGTMQVADIRVGTSSSSPTDFFVSGTKLFFEANVGNGSEPYVYDGTNVTSLGDIRPGISGSGPNNWVDLGAVACCSPPPTTRSAPSCGPPTAPPPAPRWSATSTPAATTRAHRGSPTSAAPH